MTKWLVNVGGFSEGALAAMAEAGIYYSGAAEINELLRTFGLNRLLAEAAANEVQLPHQQFNYPASSFQPPTIKESFQP
jgi:hypothetical protein